MACKTQEEGKVSSFDVGFFFRILFGLSVGF